MTDPYPRGWIVVAAGAVDIVVSALIVVLCFRRIYGAAGPADARDRANALRVEAMFLRALSV